MRRRAGAARPSGPTAARRPGERGAPLLLALDQGTTSSRAIVFDGSGRALGSGQQALRATYPRPGWVEQDPEEIWRTQLAAAHAALAAAGVGPRSVAAIGIANQRETVVLWERATGRPVHPAIVWQDRRTAGLCARLAEEGWAPAVAARTGLRLDPYFSGTKLAWLLEHVPGSAARGARGELLAGTVDSWLLWRLTGGRVHATDATNASRTLLYDIRRLAWDGELLDRLGVPPALLPQVHPTAAVVGRTDAAVFGAEVAISALVGDQQAALFGQGCRRPGEAKCTFGTGCFLLMRADSSAGAALAAAPARGLLATVARGWDARADYALEGSVFAAGAAVDWLVEVGIAPSARAVSRLAATVADAGGAWMVPAFAGLGAPHWDPAARAAVLGLTRGVGRAQLCRACLEGVAHRCREVYEAMLHATGAEAAPLRVDGGLAGSTALLGIVADLLGVPILRPRLRETTALGAALLAGIGVGALTEDAADAAAAARALRVMPGLDAQERARQARLWGRAVEQVRAWAGGDAGGDRAESS